MSAIRSAPPAYNGIRAEQIKIRSPRTATSQTPARSGFHRGTRYSHGRRPSLHRLPESRGCTETISYHSAIPRRSVAIAGYGTPTSSQSPRKPSDTGRSAAHPPCCILRGAHTRAKSPILANESTVTIHTPLATTLMVLKQAYSRNSPRRNHPRVQCAFED